MKVKIEISEEYDPAYAVIYTKAVTEEIRKVSDLLQQESGPVTAYSEDRLVVLHPEEIYMVRVEAETTVIYSSEKMSIGIKYVIHIGIGIVVQTITAFIVGWIPAGAGALKCILIIACEVATAMIIWLCFFFYNKKQVDKMNKRIQALK